MTQAVQPFSLASLPATPDEIDQLRARETEHTTGANLIPAKLFFSQKLPNITIQRSEHSGNAWVDVTVIGCLVYPDREVDIETGEVGPEFLRQVLWLAELDEEKQPYHMSFGSKMLVKFILQERRYIPTFGTGPLPWPIKLRIKKVELDTGHTYSFKRLVEEVK